MMLLVLGLLQEKLLPRWAPVKCANCGATVDSRFPGCPNCKMSF